MASSRRCLECPCAQPPCACFIPCSHVFTPHSHLLFPVPALSLCINLSISADLQIINDTLPALVKLRESGKASSFLPSLSTLPLLCDVSISFPYERVLRLFALKLAEQVVYSTAQESDVFQLIPDPP